MARAIGSDGMGARAGRVAGAEVEREFPERWSAERLAELMPGSTRKWWLVSAIPQLVRDRVLRKMGKVWIGRRSDIASALLGSAA